MTIGRDIYEMRLKKRKKIDDVAASACLPVEVLNDIEQDQCPVSDGAVIYDIAKALGVSTAELLNNPQYESRSRTGARKILRPYLWGLAKQRGARLKNRREYVGYSVSEAAKELRRSVSFVHEHERGSILGISYEIATSFANVYECDVDWILGNQPDLPLGPPISNSKTFTQHCPFLVYPAHIAELMVSAGINERQMANKIRISVADFRAYTKLSRIELPEELFVRLHQCLGVGPKELRNEPIRASRQEDVELQSISSDVLCGYIISAVAGGRLSKKNFCQRFNLSDAQWQLIETKKMKFSDAAVAVISPLLNLNQI